MMSLKDRVELELAMTFLGVYIDRTEPLEGLPPIPGKHDLKTLEALWNDRDTPEDLRKRCQELAHGVLASLRLEMAV